MITQMKISACIFLLFSIFNAGQVSAGITEDLLGNWKRESVSSNSPDTKEISNAFVRKLKDGRIHIFSELDLKGKRVKDVQIWLQKNLTAKSQNEIIHFIDDKPAHLTGFKVVGNGNWWQRKSSLHITQRLFNEEDKKRYSQTIVFRKISRNHFSYQSTITGFGKTNGKLIRKVR